MSANDYLRDKLSIFQQFEATLTDVQRNTLLQNPDLLSADVVDALYQASLTRVAQGTSEPRTNRRNAGVGSGRETADKKPRKVVNSWMAFRSYYSPLIKDLPQKVRSPMLAMLWKHDVDHGLWELLSAAFSHTRDNHGEDGVTIEQFLCAATQIVPVIPADEYFGRAGWERVGDGLRKIEVRLQEPSKATNVSCAGLVRYCHRQGLISKAPTSQQAGSKLERTRHGPPSNISFAAIGSKPVGRIDARQQQPANDAQSVLTSMDLYNSLQHPEIVETGQDDIDNESHAFNAGFDFQLFGRSPFHEQSAIPDFTNSQQDLHSSDNSPLGTATPSSGTQDLRDVFHFSSITADDFQSRLGEVHT